MAVVTAEHALVDTQLAFDGVASRYHQSNVENAVLAAMRARARSTFERHVPPGSRVLDLGCGPGTDLVPLAERGFDVTGIDWSAAMVDEASRRIEQAGVYRHARVAHLGMHELGRLSPLVFDAAYSNFGALNCVPDVDGAARAIGARLRRGGVLVASVIGRVCPWEVALFSARGAWSRALLRFSREAVPVPLEGRVVWTRYFTPAELTRHFIAHGFAVTSVRALNLFAPPPYLASFAARHRAAVACLQRIDDRIGTWPGLRTWGDHFLVVLRKM